MSVLGYIIRLVCVVSCVLSGLPSVGTLFLPPSSTLAKPSDTALKWSWVHAQSLRGGFVRCANVETSPRGRGRPASRATNIGLFGGS